MIKALHAVVLTLVYRISYHISLVWINIKEARQTCANKFLTAIHLKKYGIPTPKTMLYDSKLTFENHIPYPVIVKEFVGNCGEDVYMVNSREELLELLATLHTRDFLIQEVINESLGRDLRVLIVGNEIVASYERNNSNNWRSNVALGGKTRPYKLTKKQIKDALEIARHFDLDYTGIDFLFSNQGLLVCEVNTNPEFKGVLDNAESFGGQYAFPEKVITHLIRRYNWERDFSRRNK